MSKVLIEAAKKGNLKELDKLLKDTNHTINEVDKATGKTALHWSAATGDAATIKALVELGANVNAVDRDGGTALHDAAEEGNTATIEALVRFEANINASCEYGRTALHRAALYGQIHAIEILVKLGADVNAVDNVGMTALRYAGLDGMEMLAKLGANVNAVDEQGCAVMHWAALNFGKEGIINEEDKIVQSKYLKLLLKFGAFVDTSPSDITDENIIVINSTFSSYRIALQKLFNVAANPQLNSEKEWNSIWLVLDDGLNGRFQKDAKSALHIAIEKNRELALWLLAKGTPYHILDKDNRSALDILNDQKPSPYKNLCLALIEVNSLKDKVKHYQEQKAAHIPANESQPALIDRKSSMEVIPALPQAAIGARRAAAAAAEAPAPAAGAGAGAVALASATAAKIPIKTSIEVVPSAIQSLEQQVSNILELIGFNNTLSLDDKDFDSKIKQEELSAHNYLDNARQTVCVELGNLIVDNLSLFQKSVNNAIKLLKSVRSDHPGFKKANAHLYDAIPDATQAEKIKYLLSAGKESLHYDAIGNLMADKLGHGLDRREMRDIKNVNGEELAFKLFLLAEQFKEEKETAEKAALAKEKEARDEISRLKKLLSEKINNNNTDREDQGENVNGNAIQYSAGAKRNIRVLVSTEPSDDKKQSIDGSPSAKKQRKS